MNLTTMKATDSFLTFLKRISAYRYAQKTDTEQLAMQEIPNIIETYFKLNNDRYIELIKLTYGNK
jgi:hypothetical protein